MYHLYIKGSSWSLVVCFGWWVHRRRMVVEYPTTYAIIAYHHESCGFESCSLQGVLDTTLFNKVCQ